MRNFFRALRGAWPYRGRLALSIVCALCAAVFWGLSIASIGPVLQLLDPKNKSLQDWAESNVKEIENKIRPWKIQRDELALKQEEWESRAHSRERSRELVHLANGIAHLDRQLAQAGWRKYWCQTAEYYLSRFGPRDRFLTLAWLVVLGVAAMAAKGVFEFGQDSLVGSVVNLTLFDLRNHFYRNVVHLDVNDFGEQGTHELMSRFTNDIELLGNGTKTLFGKVISEPLRALACVILACLVSWQLTLMFLVLVPIALFILTKVGRLMKRATRRLLERTSSIFKILQETFQGIRIVKAFTMEPYERRRFRAATKDYYHKAMWVVNLDALASPVIELLGVAAIGAALLAGSYLVLRERTDLFGIQMADWPLGHIELIQLYGFLAAIADPVRKLSSVYTRLQSGAAAADRIYAYMDRQPRVVGNASGDRLPTHEASIEFRDVCFSYEPGRSILTNVTLSVRFGETIALVGKNGCGKTTLVGLIPRFYDPEHGSVLVDGMDLRRVSLRSLRQQIGIVTQESVLFDDTIHNNIAYGYRRAARTQVEKAAERAFAHDFITKLPNGYETRIGEAGSKLSGGQKQRIALARALLRNPRILILDEFTSQSDAESEALIHRALKEFRGDRTTFVITHRLNTLEITDRIVVVDNGRIEAVGTHQELMASCPIYQRLREAQFHRLCA
jgi:ATP-binding cassette subfamily B protein/subfamily B ATP-binding cassette protein MsbA